LSFRIQEINNSVKDSGSIVAGAAIASVASAEEAYAVFYVAVHRDVAGAAASGASVVCSLDSSHNDKVFVFV